MYIDEVIDERFELFIMNQEIESESYYESRKREVKTKPMYECRCDERLKTKSEKSTHISYTGLIGELDSGTRTPKHRDEVNRRDVSECDG
jgi:hypothetical protein